MSESLPIKSLFRNYNVHFVSDFTLPLGELASNNAFFIVDATIWDIYNSKLKTLIPDGRFRIIEANENNKSLEECRQIIEILVDRKVRRNEVLVAIGGGIIQDVTAFSASVIYRGLEWAFFPTTLLAQADSGIGSKTSINLSDKKNLIGNFYPPSDVFIDALFLDSLELDDIKSGIGEILHYYLYAASPLFDELIQNYEMVIRDRSLLMKHIQQSLRIKKPVIEEDEFDRGERNKFNYGHTFGHAIESVTNYAIRHGQAITIGMDLANYVSMKMGFMRPEIFHDLHAKLSVNFPENDWKRMDLDYFCEILSADKKNVGDNIGCIIAKEPGVFLKVQIPLADNLAKMIRGYFIDYGAPTYSAVISSCQEVEISTNNTPYLDLAVEAARKAGHFLLKNIGKKNNIISEDDEQEIHFQFDLESEEIIINELRSGSMFNILTEESGLIDMASGAQEYSWIVDPMDGSINYSMGIPFSCVSVSLWKGASPVFGVIYDFYRNHMYIGIIGLGAWLNGLPIKINLLRNPAKAILCTGFPASLDFTETAISSFISRGKRFRKIRMLGTAALSLAFVASGKMDAYYEKNIKIWDVAAGLALVKAAGGEIICKGFPESHVVEAYGGASLSLFADISKPSRLPKKDN